MTCKSLCGFCWPAYYRERWRHSLSTPLTRCNTHMGGNLSKFYPPPPPQPPQLESFTRQVQGPASVFLSSDWVFYLSRNVCNKSFGWDYKPRSPVQRYTQVKDTVGRYTMQRYTQVKDTVGRYTMQRYTQVKDTVGRYTMQRYTQVKDTVVHVRVWCIMEIIQHAFKRPEECMWFWITL